MFPISLPSLSNSIKGQILGSVTGTLFCMSRCAPQIPTLLLHCPVSCPPPGSFPQFLSILMPLAPTSFLLLTPHRNTSHHTFNYEVDFTFLFSFFLPSSLLPLKLKFTAMYNHCINSFTSSQFPFHISHSLLPKAFHISKRHF